MRKLSLITFLLLLVCPSSEARVFVAARTDSSNRDDRAKLFVGDSIEKIGTHDVYYLRIGEKSIKFNRYSLISFTEGFNPKENYNSSLKVKQLKENRLDLVQFAERFSKGKEACEKELQVVDDALARLAKGEFYRLGKWTNPNSPQLSNSPAATLDYVLNDFTTKNGILIKNGKVTKLEGDRISVMHDGGFARIPYEELPKTISKRLGLTEKTANEARIKRALKGKRKK